MNCELISSHVGLTYESFLKGLTMYICRNKQISSSANSSSAVVNVPYTTYTHGYSRGPSPKHRSPRHSAIKSIYDTPEIEIMKNINTQCVSDSTSDSGYENNVGFVRRKRMKSSSKSESEEDTIDINDSDTSSGLGNGSISISNTYTSSTSSNSNSNSSDTTLPRRMSGIDIGKYKFLSIPLDVSLGNNTSTMHKLNNNNTATANDTIGNKRMVNNDNSYSIYEAEVDSDVSELELEFRIGLGKVGGDNEDEKE